MASPHSITVTPPSSSISGEPHVEHLGQLLETVDVEVVQLEPALVVAGQGEGRAGDAVRSRPGPGAEALGEGGLARAQLAGQQDHVAGAHQLGQGRRQRLWCSATERDRASRVTRSPAGGQGQLGPHEVGPHVGQRLAAPPQRVGRVERRDEHGRARTGTAGPAAW